MTQNQSIHVNSYFCNSKRRKYRLRTTDEQTLDEKHLRSNAFILQ